MPRLPTPSDFPPSLTLDIIPPPPSSRSPSNILILLHGLGDTQTSFTRLAQQLNLPETACISLRGLHPIPALFTGSEVPSFHWGDDVLVDEGRGELDVDAGFKISGEVLGRVVREVLVERCQFPARNILFYGFGQGGMLTLHLASLISSSSSSSPEAMEFGGIISIGGRLPSTSTSTSSSSKSKTPILVCGGSRSTQITRQSIDVLKSRFADVEYVKWEKHEDSMPRSREEMLPIMKFFARRLRSRAGVPEGAVEV